VWGLNHGTPENITAFHNLVPSSRPIAVCLSCCNQFIVSRDAIRRLPLTVWRQLLLVLGEQPACRLEEPDYENLFVYRNQPTEANKPGPEPADLPQYNERKGEGFVWMPVLYLLVFFGFSCNILPFIWYGDDYCIKWSGSDGTHRALQWNIWLMWSLANMAWIWNILSSQRYVRTSCITPNVQALLVTKTSPTKLDDWMSVCVCRELGLKKGFFYVIIFDNLKYYKGKRFYYVTPRFSNKSRVFDKLLGAWLLRFL